MKLNWNAFKADFNLNGITEVYFWKSEWETFDPHDLNTPVSLLYVGYRFLYFLYFFIATIENFICFDEYNRYWFVFLTNQTFTFQLIHSGLFFGYIFWIYLDQKRRTKNETPRSKFDNKEYRLPLICKILWIFLNVLQVVPYAVSMVYWLVLFRDTVYIRTCDMVDDLLVHAFNTPMVILDAFIISIVIRPTHCVFPIINALAYSIFSLIYELAGGSYINGKYIYTILDWKSHPGFAVVSCFGGAIFGLVGHVCFASGLFRLRIFLKSKFVSNSNKHALELQSEVNGRTGIDDTEVQPQAQQSQAPTLGEDKPSNTNEIQPV